MDSFCIPRLLALAFAIGVGAHISAPSALAVPPQCGEIVTRWPDNMLYKPANFHGARGPSWINGCQAKQHWTGSNKFGSRLRIYGEDGTILRYRFKLWDPGTHTFGRRYYTGVGTTSQKLLQQAQAAGGNAIYIQGKDTRCYKVKNPLNRQGKIRALPGLGAC
ncbi:MAG: hypothetical protein EBZ48_03755 [Proteobacteria bacterium]|nr:hypothetical protein [Pseudomonadota bacterium]